MQMDSSGFAPGLKGAATGRRFGLAAVETNAPSRVAVVTMTRARTALEGRELAAALGVLLKNNLPVFAGDGGSLEGFLKQVSRWPNLHICPPQRQSRTSLVEQLRRAFAKAQQIHPQYLLYTEPDKRAFFARSLPPFLTAATAAAGPAPGLVVAARTARGFASYPRGQRIAESFMNRLCSEALGQAGDYTYGPMLISARLLSVAPAIPENLGWGWRFFLIAVAHQLRMPIRLCTVTSQCPRSQRGEDSAQARDYRLRQLQENVTGLANGWTCLLDQPTMPVGELVVAA
jgi:hypothetical protein